MSTYIWNIACVKNKKQREIWKTTFWEVEDTDMDARIEGT